MIPPPLSCPRSDKLQLGSLFLAKLHPRDEIALCRMTQEEKFPLSSVEQ